MGNFIVLSGTPGVGTRHLKNALTQLHPHLPLERAVLATSRQPRPREEDGRAFHFRDAKALYEMATETSRYLCFQVRSDKYALDLDEVRGIAGLEGKTGLLEIPPAFFPKLSRRLGEEKVSFTSVFVSPLYRDEIGKLIIDGGGLKGGGLENAAKHVEALTAGKLIFGMLLAIRRGEINEAALQDITAQAQGAFDELKFAAGYQWVLPNHCGDDDPNWGHASEDPVFGDPARTLASFAAIARGEVPPYAETWQGLFPAQGTLAMGVPVTKPQQ